MVCETAAHLPRGVAARPVTVQLRGVFSCGVGRCDECRCAGVTDSPEARSASCEVPPQAMCDAAPAGRREDVTRPYELAMVRERSLACTETTGRLDGLWRRELPGPMNDRIRSRNGAEQVRETERIRGATSWR